MAFAARTWNMMAVPLASAVMVRLVAPAAAGLARPTWRWVVALMARTVYPVIAEPPSAGAVQRTTAEPLPPVAVPMFGAEGTVAAGVTRLDAMDSGPVPMALTARTWKVYAVPLVSRVSTVPVQVAGMPVTVC